MTTAVHRYPISAFKDVMRSGFEAHLPDSVLEMIRSLADKVGAADYIRTPKFPRQQAGGGGGSGHAMGDGWSVQGGKRRRNRRAQEVSNDDWEALRTFSATKIEKQEGIDASIAAVRKHLNKMTDKTYDAMVEQIKEEMGNIISGDEPSESELQDLRKVAGTIFTIASGNAFFSELYARLYKDMMAEFPSLGRVLKHNLDEFGALLTEPVVVVNPQEDYDKFCEVNKTNERRRATAKFYVNMMNLGVVDGDTIMSVLRTQQERILDGKDDADSAPASQELSEIVYIMTLTGREEFASQCPGDWERVVSDVEEVSKCRGAGISKKAMFKHMDILDALRQ